MNTAVIVAGGKGTRMNMGINKLYLDIKGKAILARTLDVFFASHSIDEVILVIGQGDEENFKEKVLNDINICKPFKLVTGGKERQDSVYNGISNMSKDSDIVVIHDGARPFITKNLVEESINQAKIYGAVTLGVPAKDTIKIVGEDRFIINTPDRSSLWLTQTPQTFATHIIVQAYEFCRSNGIMATDDAMLVEKTGYRVKMIEGSYDNIKITTPDDMILAELLLESGRIKDV
ncbi:2-C-methyl-D-erythritol 4-phosphate cytidylyltransferase [Lutispora thermophila]|uniref:2-C-methyl-D-erythritol 4-phosphate cytidylyltransferase n=1 Tax=Lutispora thermophila DSM 19022 TaxID=1122184 RepID=A0A1M6IB41_9FIRM|nr:2-C-methyl-D-erythritol 4-phosphate cytidylyltransferase [Lutispora thermophila]SHJ31598.1 2-C-methyl-D-erythritol 4-phosphate cytidylyltransferase [Lutispora thermophila DSM 19022]